MIVKEIMNEDVKIIEPDATVQEAAQKMTDENSKCLIVTEKGKLVGIVTDWDFVSKVVAKAEDSKGLKVKDIMTKDVIVIGPDTDISEAAEIMVEHNIKKLPVVVGNVLVGIVTPMEIAVAEPKLLEQISSLVLLSKRQRPVAG
jgi:CBS domain-containing protein